MRTPYEYGPGMYVCTHAQTLCACANVVIRAYAGHALCRPSRDRPYSTVHRVGDDRLPGRWNLELNAACDWSMAHSYDRALPRMTTGYITTVGSCIYCSHTGFRADKSVVLVCS